MDSREQPGLEQFDGTLMEEKEDGSSKRKGNKSRDSVDKKLQETGQEQGQKDILAGEINIKDSRIQETHSGLIPTH